VAGHHRQPAVAGQGSWVEAQGGGRHGRSQARKLLVISALAVGRRGGANLRELALALADLFGEPGQGVEQALDAALRIVAAHVDERADALADLARVGPLGEKVRAIVAGFKSRPPAFSIVVNHDAHEISLLYQY